MEPAPNVLFICVDSMRSDFALGEYGSEKPLFQSLQRRGTVFDTMIAAAASTTPSVASYMTGQYPPEHGVLSLLDFALDATVPTLAELFEAAGYETAAHVTGPITSDTGLDAGFETYEYRDQDRSVYTDWFDDLRADLAAQSEPWFTYLHLWEPHIHRDLPPDAGPGDIPYDASVRGVAAKLSELLAVVDLDETLVAVTGDHGESFLDGSFRQKAAVVGLNQIPIPFSDARTRDLRSAVYERYLSPNGIELADVYNRLRRFSARPFPNSLYRKGHGYHVYDFLTRVPFVIAGPGVPAGRRVDDQVRQVDVFPTLLSAAGLQPPDDVEGQDLLAGEIDARPAYIRAVGALESEDRWLDGVRYDGWKFVRGRERPVRQLFDLESDPDELYNVVDEHPAKAAELESLVDEFVARERGSAEEAAPAAQRRMVDRLEDLGYI